MTAGTLTILFVLLFGGFIIPKRKNQELLLFERLIFYSDDHAHMLFHCSIYAILVAVGILGFSFVLWRDSRDRE